MKIKGLLKLLGGIGLVVVVMALLMGGCAKPAPAPAPTPAPAEEVIKWTCQDYVMPGDPMFIASKNFTEVVNKACNGRLVIELFPGDAIVPSTQELDALDKGVLDVAVTCAQFSLDKVPTAGLFQTTVGGLSTVQRGLWYMSGEGEELLREAFKGYTNVMHLVWVGCPPEDFAYTTLPLNTVDDLKKMKMRTAGEGGEVMQKLGASTVFLPGGELYESCQRGVINSFEYMSAASAYDMGFHEVVDYLYLSHSRAPADESEIWVNKDSWNKLPDDLKQIVATAAENEMWRYYAYTVAADAVALEKIRDYGVQVLPIPKEIEDAVNEMGAKFYDEKAAKDPFYGKVLASLRAWKSLCELQGIS